MSARGYVLNKRRQGNITVEKTENSVEVYLHGNKIVSHNLTDDKIEISSCGWETVTTKTALNRYFRLADVKAHIYQSKFVWYLTLENREFNLDKYGNEFTFFKGTRTVVNTKIAKKVHSKVIVKETETELTIRS